MDLFCQLPERSLERDNPLLYVANDESGQSPTRHTALSRSWVILLHPVGRPVFAPTKAPRLTSWRGARGCRCHHHRRPPPSPQPSHLLRPTLLLTGTAPSFAVPRMHPRGACATDSMIPSAREQIKLAKNAYVKALEYNKNHAKALQQLGWLHYKDEDDFRSAIEYLKRASEIGTQNRRFEVHAPMF